MNSKINIHILHYEIIDSYFNETADLKSFTVEPHLSGHLRSQTDFPDNWISG